MAKRLEDHTDSDSLDPASQTLVDPTSTQQSIRTGLLMRTLTLTRLGLVLSSRTAGRQFGRIFSNSQNEEERQREDREHLVKQARDIATQMSELKGSVLKVGQMLSLYGEHFLPPEVNMVFRELHSGARPLSWALVQPAILRQPFAADLMAHLELEQRSLACASLGQVHRARLKSKADQVGGVNEWVVKIQHPGIDQAVHADLKALQVLLSWGRLLNVPKVVIDGLFDEISSMLTRELDYICEAETADRYRHLLASDMRYFVPVVHPLWRSRNCLVMELAEGFAVDSPEVRGLSEERRRRLADAILDLHFREIFSFRMVQTDAHLGNFLIQIDDSPGSADRWALLDFGAIRDYPEAFVESYRRLVRASLNNDHDTVRLSALELGFLHESDSPELCAEFTQLCSLFTEPFRGPYDWSQTDLPERIASQVRALVARFEFRPPPRDILFLDRKVSGLSTLLRHLSVTTDGRALIEKYL